MNQRIQRSMGSRTMLFLATGALLASSGRAQDVIPSSVDIRLAQGPAGDQVQVQLMAHSTAPFTGVLSAITASIRYNDASGSTLGAGSSFCTAWSSFAPSGVVTNMGNAYRTYNGFGLSRLDQAAGGGGCAVTIPQETWFTISTITVGGTACTSFTLGNDGYTQANNRNYYISMNGVDVTGNIVGGAVTAGGGCAYDCLGVPGGPALPGTPCDDGDPNSSNDVYGTNCQCSGTCDQEAFKLDITPDANGDEITWALTRANGTPVATGGPYPSATSGVVLHEQVCLSAGCYKFTLTDAGGDGIPGGGYQVRDGQGNRLIDADGGFTATSAIGASFCLPASSVTVNASSCDNMAFTNGSSVVVDAVPGATSYQFWFFDPHGGLQKKITRPGTVFTVPPGMNLPDGRWMNVRVRAQVAAAWSEYGPACVLVLADPPGMQLGGGPGASEQFVDAERRLWPNPVEDGRLNVDLTGLRGADQHIRLDIQDIYGKQVLGREFSNSGDRFTTLLELPGGMAEGVYLVYITINDESTVQRLNVLR
ncbi:MAG: T9SS type A sorting domain-containing protein [Flavobacteriales bacterium]|nr:T9SS type A sorting domain-containing protein [Flavobacteriales bacterium]